MKNKKKFLQVINKGGLKWFQFNIYLTCKFIFIFFNVILIYVGIKKIFIFHPIPRSSFGLILVNIFFNMSCMYQPSKFCQRTTRPTLPRTAAHALFIFFYFMEFLYSPNRSISPYKWMENFLMHFLFYLFPKLRFWSFIVFNGTLYVNPSPEWR